jgi:hypothetical protein
VEAGLALVQVQHVVRIGDVLVQLALRSNSITLYPIAGRFWFSSPDRYSHLLDLPRWVRIETDTGYIEGGPGSRHRHVPVR